MNYKLGDYVRIVSTGQRGCICDISVCDGQLLYIVELDTPHGLAEESHSICDYLTTVEHSDIISESSHR